MSFTLSPELNRNKVFILQKSKIEKRLDPFYYVPELVELENKVLSKNPKRLRKYVQNISSGATPRKSETDLYYSDALNGIPFLRVQNLLPTGILEFEDCKFINNETHTKMLKRSQVFPGDLLIKITGVGRMAVASVVPDDFEGNINQHICVIRTGSKEISETIAAFLNSDIGERLASRRSTGGTRPALDYPALLSIPIIEDKRILEITTKVVEQKKQNEAEAEKLLSSIDDYLLGELGIKIPEMPENTLKNRMYITAIKSIAGNRFDSFFHQQKFTENIQVIINGRYPVKPIHELIQGNLIKGTLPKSNEKDGNNYVIQINCINSSGSIEFDDLLTAKDIFSKSQRLLKGDILVVITGATIGKVAFWYYDGEYFLGGDIVKFQTNGLANSSYVFNFLRCSLSQIEIKRDITGATNGHLSPEDVAKLVVPIPPLDKQIEIAEHISSIRAQAQQLKDKTKAALEQANKEIEKILLQ